MCDVLSDEQEGHEMTEQEITEQAEMDARLAEVAARHAREQEVTR